MKSTTKKTVAALMASLIIFGLAACGTNDATPPEKTSKPSVAESTGEANPQAEKDQTAASEERDYQVEDTDGGVSITRYIGDETIVEIPAQIGGKDVVSIGKNAFLDNVVKVTLPDTVTRVDYKAFVECASLVEVTLGANVETLDSCAFAGCTSLTTVNLNDKLRSIDADAFAGTISLKEITLPSSLEKIGEGAFSNGGIEKITIPGSVKLVDYYAFSDCKNLTEAVLEEGVTTLGVDVFGGCPALTKVVFPASLKEIGQEIGQRNFYDSKNVVIYGPAGSLAESYAAKNGLAFESIS